MLLVPMPPQSSQPASLQLGMVIDKSVTVKPAVYRLSALDAIKSPVLTIHGENITIDFHGATMEGTPQDTPPDRRTGLAILVDASTNVTIKNAKIRGYKVAILARNSSGLKLLNCDWSFNWKQHLHSTLELEDESDWMSFHHNENDEWIYSDDSFGAGGAYLSGCDNFEVRGCRNIGSQCGLMLNRCNRGKVLGNDFSFLSAIGVGLYRSSNNAICGNNIDYCVRGYSHGVYSRGQDSAAILVYEQSNGNVFAYNSATHGGDGFFLWAGQHTMDTGEGGCNDNLVVGNDFSHAPTNGIEATFSRNSFIGNRMVECWHGVWGGYSYASIWANNVFKYCGQAFAIEHGQNNMITDNWISDCDEGIALWAEPVTDPNWGYPKHRDTASRVCSIGGNTFLNTVKTILSIGNTADAEITGNGFSGGGTALALKGSCPGLRFDRNSIEGGVSLGDVPTRFQSNNDIRAAGPAPSLPAWLKGDGSNRLENDPSLIAGGFATPRAIRALPQGVKKGVGKLEEDIGRFRAKTVPERGRRYILVDEWGPYDFRAPIIWPRGETRGMYRFEILGPPGKWRLADSTGFANVPREGSVPGHLELAANKAKAMDLRLTLEYTGKAVTSPLGVQTAAGEPYRFSFSKFFLPIDWHVKFFKWDATTDPRTEEQAFDALLKAAPIKEDTTDKLDYAGYGAMAPGLPPDHYATLAEGNLSLPAGDYTLNLTTDDGARAWVDGKPAITNAWHYQGPTRYTAHLHLGTGAHSIRVEHFQIDGYATLKVEIQRAAQ